MTIEVIEIDDEQAAQLLGNAEGHFLDFKAIEVKPAKLSETVCAFANAEGGDLYVGVDEGANGFDWRGFASPEDANGHVHALERLFPLGDEFSYEFLASEVRDGLLLHVAIQKSSRVFQASNGKVYLRRNAGKLLIDSEEGLRRLQLDKGIASFEDETVDVELDALSESEAMRRYIEHNVPKRTGEDVLRTRLLLRRGLPRVAAVLVFLDLPQAALPERSAVKVSRYRTTGVPNRESLVGQPETVEGCLYDLIYGAVEVARKLIEAHQVVGEHGMEAAKYPEETLHEVITNAVMHRDYSIPDYVHIRIFDNRVEVESPGRLPGGVTVQNILAARALRNGKIVSLVNKFPNPPNKDMGEGLNTAADAMRAVRLHPPRFEETAQNTFVVTIPHESLATAEELILEHIETHDSITNREARTLYPTETQHIMRQIIARMCDEGLLEKVPGTQRGGTRYRRPTGTGEGP
jgi:ATP-dependent DNA helicase RecG